MMGLDTTHDAWHGGYCHFNAWRVWLATKAGIPFDLMDGCADWVWEECDVEAIPFGDPKRSVIAALAKLGRPIGWEMLEADPLALLLHHSDCGGKIRWWQCRGLALRLAGIYRTHPGAEPWLRKATLRFALGCWRAWKKREHLGFH